MHTRRAHTETKQDAQKPDQTRLDAQRPDQPSHHPPTHREKKKDTHVEIIYAGILVHTAQTQQNIKHK